MPTESTDFSSPTLLALLEAMSPEQLDDLPYGVIRMKAGGEVTAYNRYEGEMAQVDTASAVGKNFFTEIGPCTNNFLVAHRYETEEALDEEMDYLFTFVMKPTKVRLRLLKGPGTSHYLLVKKT